MGSGEEMTQVVGRTVKRKDAYEKVTGRAEYVFDVKLPNMLYGKILRSPHPHARIVKIDASKAEKLPGVKAVITGRDTWGIRMAFVETPSMPADEPPLAEDKVRYVGEGVAAVAAVNEETAEEALQLIEVEYEPLDAVFDPEEAMKPEAPKIHDVIKPTGRSFWEEWGVAREIKPQRIENNIASTCFFSIGDVEKGFNDSDLVREDEFQTSPYTHCAMEPHGVVARFDNARRFLDIWLGHMGFAMKQYWLARTLGIPTGNVRIHSCYIGGAFGGKIELQPHEFIAAFLSKKTGHPVKIVLSREEVFTATRTAHPFKIRVKTGVKRDGRIVAQHVRVIDDCGAYRGTGPVVIYLAHAFSQPIYNIPNYRYEAYAVYTNQIVRIPQRGHGAPQIRFAIEQQLDMISEELGLDPAEVRLKNIRKKGDILPNGDVLNSCGLKDGIEALIKETNWKEKRKRRIDDGKAYGIGMGIGAMFSGAQYYPFGNVAQVKVNEDGTATVYSPTVDTGQGAATLMAQIVAETLGISLEDVNVVTGDSELCPIGTGNWLSGGTFVLGRAAKLAAEDAKRQILEAAVDLFRGEVRTDDLEIRGGHVFVKDAPENRITLREVIRYAILTREGKQILGEGYTKAIPYAPEVNWYPSLHTAKGRFTGAYSFAVTVAEVEVDLETGRTKVLKVTTADDCGYPINPSIVEGQIEGQVLMGMGQALFEEVITSKKTGRILNPTFTNYKIATTKDAPEIKTIHIITNDPWGPFGAKEVGEGAVAAVVSAIANAVAHAIGSSITQLPITPEKTLKSIKNAENIV
ncbi:MAG TPA: hypothetical protein EYP20_05475 [Aigarchaeota archaeon]|nr:hypothetical protein [Aigarchaeota archaeon]